MVSLCLRTAVATCGQRGQRSMLFLVHAGLTLFNSSLTLETQTLPCCPVNSRCAALRLRALLLSPFRALPWRCLRKRHVSLIPSTPLARRCAPSTLPPVCVMAVSLFKVSEPHLSHPLKGSTQAAHPYLEIMPFAYVGALFISSPAVAISFSIPPLVQGTEHFFQLLFKSEGLRKQTWLCSRMPCPHSSLVCFHQALLCFHSIKKFLVKLASVLPPGSVPCFIPDLLRFSLSATLMTRHCSFLTFALREIWVFVSFRC